MCIFHSFRTCFCIFLFVPYLFCVKCHKNHRLCVKTGCLQHLAQSFGRVRDHLQPTVMPAKAKAKAKGKYRIVTLGTAKRWKNLKASIANAPWRKKPVGTYGGVQKAIATAPWRQKKKVWRAKPTLGRQHTRFWDASRRQAHDPIPTPGTFGMFTTLDTQEDFNLYLPKGGKDVYMVASWTPHGAFCFAWSEGSHHVAPGAGNDHTQISPGQRHGLILNGSGNTSRCIGSNGGGSR